MIINKLGTEFTHEGIKYTIGAPVIATDQSEYEGLYGTITEIRDGADKETENETPDIYCAFEPPVLPCEIKALEETFSGLYGEPKTLGTIILDMVIMAPEMVQTLESLYFPRYQLPIITVVEDWAMDGESGHCEELLSNHADAKRVLHGKMREELEHGCIPNWEGNTEFTVDSTPCSYECWLDGEYSENHYKIELRQDKVFLSKEVFETIGRAYIDQSRTKAFVSQCECWDEVEGLSETQRQHFFADPRIPERIHNRLDKNDSYWESYWESVSEVAHELLSEYLKQGAQPKCFTPEPNNPYPLCIGKGEDVRRTCCLSVKLNNEGGHDQ